VRSLAQLAQFKFGNRAIRIHKISDDGDLGHQLVQQIESLRCQADAAKKAYARDVAGRSAQVGHEADFD
jgi:hypothetical protein